MKLKTILTTLVLLQAMLLSAQVKDSTTVKSAFWENVHFGGGLQLGIGNFQTTLGVSPSAIYSFSDDFATGISGSYIYSKFKYSDVNYHIYGGSALALYNPLKELQISTEFEYLTVFRKSNNGNSSYQVPALYGGIAYRVGKFSAIGLRYDFLYNSKKSIYDNAFTPFVRLYF